MLVIQWLQEEELDILVECEGPITMIDHLIENWETEIRRGAIQLLVCSVLTEQDLHGKGICDTIWEKTGEIIEVPLGTVYPLLRRFVKDGLIETYKPDYDQRKTIYKLNSKGSEYYRLMEEMWNRYSVAVSNVLHTTKY